MRPPRKFFDQPFDYHQSIEIDIDALSNLGVGIGRITLNDEHTPLSAQAKKNKMQGQWVVFVPHTLPGERVLASIFRNDKSHSQADLIRVLSPSNQRVTPQCVLFGQCGGCQYQHLGYSEQLAWKTRQVAELFSVQLGMDVAVNPAIRSPKQWAYRSKITPHFHPPKKGEINAIGFLQTGQRSRLIDVPHCPIAMESINQHLPLLRRETFSQSRSFKKGGTLLLRATPQGVETHPNIPITEEVRIGTTTYYFDFLAGDFFQNNPFILPEFVAYAAKLASADGMEYLVDAYCGSGLFSICLAKHFKKVASVEISQSAADWARHNAQKNAIDNADFLAASAEDIFADIVFSPDKTTVLIDPPRKGSTPEFLEQLFAFRPKRVVYISCNPATQIRDLGFFFKESYRLREVQPFDLFPQTRHLECIALLERIDD